MPINGIEAGFLNFVIISFDSTLNGIFHYISIPRYSDHTCVWYRILLSGDITIESIIKDVSNSFDITVGWVRDDILFACECIVLWVDNCVALTWYYIGVGIRGNIGLTLKYIAIRVYCYIEWAINEIMRWIGKSIGSTTDTIVGRVIKDVICV